MRDRAVLRLTAELSCGSLQRSLSHAQDRNPAMKDPEKFAWQYLFVPINNRPCVGKNAGVETGQPNEDTFPNIRTPNIRLRGGPAGSPKNWPIRQLQILDMQRTGSCRRKRCLSKRPLPRSPSRG